MSTYTIIFRIQLIVTVGLLLTPVMLSAQSDDPSLINVTTLEQLHAMRYDLNGDGEVDDNIPRTGRVDNDNIQAYADAFGTPSCPNFCRGYELMNDLDFAGSKWAKGATGPDAEPEGWLPIAFFGIHDFIASFNGNNHTISNLYINRPLSRVGLFATMYEAQIYNLGVIEGNVTGKRHVALIVASSRSSIITNCYATGTVKQAPIGAGVGSTLGGAIGGLVGVSQREDINDRRGMISSCYSTVNVIIQGESNSSAGSLVGGCVFSNIRASYATGNATSEKDNSLVGGLVGSVYSGSVTACYATGNATVTSGSTSAAGGLTGVSSQSTVNACYATGRATAPNPNRAGGLVGSAFTQELINSYFDYGASGRSATEDYAKNTSDLQSPTMYDDNSDDQDESSIYENWNVDVDSELNIGAEDGTVRGDALEDDPWDFGTNSEYPALKVDFDRNGTATAYEFGGQGKSTPPPTPPTPPTPPPTPPTSPSLAIRSFSPESGAVGDPIKIAGTGFSSTTADNELSFDGGTTYVVANNFIDDTRTGVDPTIDTIVVNVPSDAVTGEISVKVNDGTPVESANDFTVLSASVLAITSISPTRGPVGEEVTIEGQNFEATAADNMVTFLGDESDEGDNQVATISEASTTRLVVNVPDDAISGPIEVEVDGETATSEAFTVTTETPFSVSKSSDVIRVYPNPTSGELSFRSLSSTDTYVYKIYSLLGQEILSDVLKGTTIDVSTLAEGQYILVLSSKGDSEVLRTRLLIVR